jgi:hypothetical protein
MAAGSRERGGYRGALGVLDAHELGRAGCLPLSGGGPSGKAGPSGAGRVTGGARGPGLGEIRGSDRPGRAAVSARAASRKKEKSPSVNCVESESNTARSMAFSSSLTLPGKG